MKIEKMDRHGNIRIYEYSQEQYYINLKKRRGTYTCPHCGSVIVNSPCVIVKHNKSKKCMRTKAMIEEKFGDKNTEI
jgi:predicted RNA-binding Zn-ribbon protein involved in translation (DUF1610 family)